MDQSVQLSDEVSESDRHNYGSHYSTNGCLYFVLPFDVEAWDWLSEFVDSMQEICEVPR